MAYNTNNATTYRQQILDYEAQYSDVMCDGQVSHKQGYPMMIAGGGILLLVVFTGIAIAEAFGAELANIIIGVAVLVAGALFVSGCIMQAIMVSHLRKLDDARRHTPSEVTYKELRGVIGCQYRTLSQLLDGTRKLNAHQIAKLYDYFGDDTLDMDALKNDGGMANIFEWAAAHREH